MSIANFFARRRTIESITAPITSIVSKLETHAELHTDKAMKHNVAVAIHQNHAADAEVEVEKAREQAAKFARLVA